EDLHRFAAMDPRAGDRERQSAGHRHVRANPRHSAIIRYARKQLRAAGYQLPATSLEARSWKLEAPSYQLPATLLEARSWKLEAECSRVFRDRCLLGMSGSVARLGMGFRNPQIHH